MNSPFCCSIILLLCRVYEQPLLLQHNPFTVQSLWTAPSVAAWPFYCADFMNNSIFCSRLTFLLCRFYEQPLLLQTVLFFCRVAVAWFCCCAEYMNSSFCCSLTFLLCRVYEHPLLLQPDHLIVQSLWTAPPGSAWSFFTVQSLWTAPPAAAWTLRPGTRGSHPCQPKTQG